MLTVDLGNTRLKAMRWHVAAGRVEGAGAWDGAGDDLDGLAHWLGLAPTVEAALGSVASAGSTEDVRQFLEERGVRVRIDPDPGIENRCSPPESVGRDRLYAAAGAAELFGRSCVVVDAGTALTVDALRVLGTERAFLGGTIAPGPLLLSRALAQWTARLPFVDPRPPACALGRNTEEAIRAGVGIGFRGAARELVEGIVAETGLLDPLIVVTGGAREHLLVPTPFTRRALAEVHDLVHRGLLVALLRGLDRGAGA
jgi:pantothenate kinase type III